MRLLTHNTMRNNTADAKGGGFPLKITAVEVRVIDNPDGNGGGRGGTVASSQQQQERQQRDVEFVRRILPTLEWPALVQAAAQMGISTLPPTLTTDLADDPAFLAALYHILMNVHLVRGMLTCPATGREFPVTDGVPNMMIDEEECERVRL